MHSDRIHQQSVIALCHAAQLPIVPLGTRRLRIPLFGHNQFLDIDLDCAPGHQFTWTLHATHLGILRQLDTGRVPCGQPWHHALLITWVGYRQQGGSVPFALWSTGPVTPWQAG